MRNISQDAVSLMLIYKLVFSIYVAHGNKEAMKDWLESANKAKKAFPKTRGLCHLL